MKLFATFGKEEKARQCQGGGGGGVVTLQRTHFCDLVAKERSERMDIFLMAGIAGDADCSWKLLLQQN